MGPRRHETIKGKVARYLRQPSTKKGILLLLNVMGVTLAPIELELVFILITGAVGLFDTLMDEDK